MGRSLGGDTVVRHPFGSPNGPLQVETTPNTLQASSTQTLALENIYFVGHICM